MSFFNASSPSVRVSPVLEKIVATVLAEQPLPGEGLAQAVANLSQLFTTARATLPARYLEDPAHAAAYLAYFFLVNLSKVQVLLNELPPIRMLAPAERPLAVLDLGCGPGTGAVAVLDWLWQRIPACPFAVSVLAADASDGPLVQATRLWDAYCEQVRLASTDLRCVVGNLEHPFKGELGRQLVRSAPYDLIILGNCLNELFQTVVDPSDSRAALITQLLPLLAPHGTVMIVEPALRQTTRALHQVRDRLLMQGGCTVYSPCLHEGACPALVRPDDWCHEERPWHPPATIVALDKAVGFIKDALKFSYLLLRTDDRTIVPRSPETFRIVSELRPLKGDTRAWLCNEQGRTEVGRLTRAASATNSVWDTAHRGAIMRLDGLIRKDGGSIGRIPAEGAVELIRPA